VAVLQHKHREQHRAHTPTQNAYRKNGVNTFSAGTVAIEVTCIVPGTAVSSLTLPDVDHQVVGTFQRGVADHARPASRGTVRRSGQPAPGASASPRGRGVVRPGRGQPGGTGLVLDEYIDHYNTRRPHRALKQGPPAGRPNPPALGANVRVLRRDRLGGLIREYAQVV
jgi:hypothetical protein